MSRRFYVLISCHGTLRLQAQILDATSIILRNQAKSTTLYFIVLLNIFSCYIVTRTASPLSASPGHPSSNVGILSYIYRPCYYSLTFSLRVRSVFACHTSKFALGEMWLWKWLPIASRYVASNDGNRCHLENVDNHFQSSTSPCHALAGQY